METTKEMTTQQAQPMMTIQDCAKIDLTKAEAEPIEMSGEYWSPEKAGESKRLFFVQLIPQIVLDMQTGKPQELLTAQFVENVNGELRTIRNGSRRLVGVFEQMQNIIKPGDAFEITYQGKEKNKNNSFLSDTWSVKRLILK